MRLSTFLSSLFISSAALVAGQSLDEDSLEKHVDTLTLSKSFNPVKEAYWTGYPHHRRTPFAVSPDGSVGYLAYLSSSDVDVIVQPVDPSTFAATGTPVTVTGAKEAGGLVAHNDGFALLTNEALPSGTSNAPAGSTPVPVLYRFDASGKQTWKTFLGGPGVSQSFGLVASPDLNGDLVYSEASGYYAAYFVVTAYSGSASGHFGDAIRYVKADTGALETIQGASSDWGCSHNTGIAFEEADQPPFASICAEDQGAIWLNTKGQGMSTVGVKISNENTTNGGSGEAMNGMSGSYSQLARFAGSNSYIFAWVSRGASLLKLNEWMGNGFTNAVARTDNRNVAIAIFSDKNTLVGEQASSVVGATNGDSQVNWVTQSDTADASNVHAAVFNGAHALVTWEEIADPTCDFVAMGCGGEFTGSLFQLVTSDGTKVGEPVRSLDTYVAGDMVTMADGRICWPYVNMEWNLQRVRSASSVTSISFACANIDGSGSGSGSSGSSSAAAPSSTAAAPTSATPVQTSAQTPVGTAIETAVDAPPVETPTGQAPIETVSALPTDQSPSPSIVTTSIETSKAPVSTPSPQAPSSVPTTLRTRTRTRGRGPCTRRA